MKKTISLLSVITFSLLLSMVSFAQDGSNKTPGVRNRQGNQQRRIRQGVRSGELTKSEAIRLEKEQKEIQQEKKEAKADGVVTAEERKDIHQEQNQASRRIYRKKHNSRDRK